MAQAQADRDALRARHAEILRRVARDRARQRGEEIRQVLEEGEKPGIGRGALAWLGGVLALVGVGVLAAPWVIAWLEAVWEVGP